MMNAFTGASTGPTTTVQEWQQEHDARLVNAREQRDLQCVLRLQRFGSWQAMFIDMVLLFAVVLVLSLLVGAGFAIYYTASHSHSTATDLTNWLTAPAALTGGLLAAQLGMVLILQLRVVGRGIMSWSDLGIGPAILREWSRAVATGIGILIVGFLASEAILSVLDKIGLDVNGQAQALSQVKHASFSSFVPFFIASVITAPLAEETFFRGYVLRALTVRYRFPAGLIASSVLFGVLHLLGGAGWAVIALVIFGAVLGWGYARTGNPLTNMTAHALNNAIGMIALYHR